MDVTPLLQGPCPQRLAGGQRVPLVLEHHEAEIAYVLAVRYVDHRGDDHARVHHVIVGRPGDERPHVVEPSRDVAFPLAVKRET